MASVSVQKTIQHFAKHGIALDASGTPTVYFKNILTDLLYRLSVIEVFNPSTNTANIYFKLNVTSDAEPANTDNAFIVPPGSSKEVKIGNIENILMFCDPAGTDSATGNSWTGWVDSFVRH